MTWNLAVITGEMRAWVEDSANRTFMYTEPLALVDELLGAAPSSQSIASVATSIESLASWEATSAAVAILANEDQWQRMQQSAYLSSWKIRLLDLLIAIDERPRRRPRYSADELALSFAGCLALGCFEPSTLLGNLLFRYGRTDRLMRPNSVLASFMTDLFQVWQKAPVGEMAAARGFYSDLIDGLHRKDPASIAQPLLDACAYHVEQSDDRGDSGFPEFEEYPHPVFPVEIIGFLEVCGTLGVKVEEPDHPLFDSPLARPQFPAAPTPPALHHQLLDWIAVVRTQRG